MMDEDYIESSDSSSNTSAHLQLPPGFRFHPTDEELVVHYLTRKLSSSPLPAPIIAELDLYKFDPWDLPSNLSLLLLYFFFLRLTQRKPMIGTQWSFLSTYVWLSWLGFFSLYHSKGFIQRRKLFLLVCS